VNDPRVTVVIPTHNRADLLPRAFQSVVDQTFDDWEIVVVDDGSHDDTPSLLGEWKVRLGDRFRYRCQEQRGAGAARNAGIDRARGRFVAFLDSDDEFLPTKLERQLRLFELRPELGFVYSDYHTVDLQGRRCGGVFDDRHPKARDVRTDLVEPGLFVCHDLFDTLLSGYFICTIVGLVRREVLGQSIRFSEDLLFGEEWLFYLQVARECRAGFVDEPLSLYRFQPGSLSRSDKGRNAAEFRRLLREIRRAFPDLKSPQRRVVRGQMAQLDRRLACTAYREGRFAEARRLFAEAWRHEPRLQTLWHWGQSLGRSILHGSVDDVPQKPAFQDCSQAVR